LEYCLFPMAAEANPTPSRWQESTVASREVLAGAAQEAVQPGELLAQRFRVVRTLAQGGMGLVIEAHDEELGARVALKLILPEVAASPAAVDRLRREVVLARRITHPNVCRVFDFFNSSGSGAPRVFFTMELLKGETLAQRIRRVGAIPLPATLELARQMSEALEAAHSQSVVHRDFKSSNVLLVRGADGVDRAVVSDFGIARAVDAQGLSDLTGTGAFLGTPAYMAPEQVVGQGTVTPATDTYAFGVVLFEMVTGQLPFQAETPLACALVRLTAPTPRASEKASGLPPLWDEVIQRCMAREPADRFARPKDAVQALTRVRPRSAPSQGGLPAQTTPFFGREAELLRLKELLVQAPVKLITLTGAGGAGKTRLAVEAAGRLSGHFSGGTFFVDLSPLTHSDQVAAAISSALGLQPNQDASLVQCVAAALRREPVLFVLDNFEHLLEAAPVVNELIRAAPQASVLATSRTLLNLSGEHDFPVSGLSLNSPAAAPASGASPAVSEAAQLFVERARALLPSFQLTAQNAMTVGAICERLDGLPLAIELAAARARVLEPEALLARLETGGGSLRTLVGGSRDVDLRKRTLRSTIAWSDGLLSPVERRLFHRFGVFAKAGSLAAAAAIAGEQGGDVLEGLSSLVDKSLLFRTEVEGTQTRFGMLQTLRDYAREQLEVKGEMAGARAQHAEHFLADAERRAPELTGPAQGRHFDELEADHDELLLARDWFRDTEAGSEMLRLAIALGHFWEIRGHWLEGQRTLEQALELAVTAPTPLKAKGLHWVGVLAWCLGDLPRSRTCHEESVAIFRSLDEPDSLMDALNALYWTVMFQGDLKGAASLNDEALQLASRIGDRRLRALAVVNRAWLACEQDRLEEGERLNEEAIAELRAYRDQSTLVRHINCRGEIARMRGDWERAEAAFVESLQVARVTRSRRQVVVSSLNLATAKLHAGAADEALALTRESLAMSRELGQVVGKPVVLLSLAQIHLARGDGRRAAQLYGGAQAALRSSGSSLLMSDKNLAEEVDRELSATLDAVQRRRLEGEGAALKLEDLLAMGLGT
jgi:predicted ATPase